jgi:hypothetical protein
MKGVKMIRIVTMSVLILAAAALADDNDQRAKLMGSWQGECPDSKEASSYVLQRSAENMHVSGSNGGKTLVEFDCKMSEECDVKDAGHRAKITMYFNGPKLVETETIGSRVIRRRFTLTGDDTIQLEVIPIEPDGKTKTIQLKRVTTQAAKQ